MIDRCDDQGRASPRRLPWRGQEEVVKTLTNVSMAMVKRLIRDESGPTTVEYAVMLLVVVLMAAAVIRSVGTGAGTAFSNVAGSVSEVL